MTGTRITALTQIGTIDPVNDPIPIVDVSDITQYPTGTTKKTTVSQMLSSIVDGLPSIKTGTYEDPNGNVVAVPGSIYFDLTNTGSPVQWVKTTGSGNTGWI